MTAVTAAANLIVTTGDCHHGPQSSIGSDGTPLVGVQQWEPPTVHSNLPRNIAARVMTLWRCWWWDLLSPALAVFEIQLYLSSLLCVTRNAAVRRLPSLAVFRQLRAQQFSCARWMIVSNAQAPLRLHRAIE
ncbi:hypothetical protein NDU88_002522 [Pleurodeles waltl]|uniref:Uncharacterized protein n=1 Tax=Pleurodeles waltl TaxID=8319 RepID=A0AAV7UVU6_PLEWA|nr:hypothetical protein NDU88_002522 [Pleurodeles waltl]